MKRKIFSLLIVLVLAMTLTSCKKNKKVEVSFSSNETSMLVGEVKTITPEVTLGKKVKNFELTYSISDPTKATVDNAGSVTALAEGTVLLTATGNDKNETSASITIKIDAPAPTVYTITYTLNGGTNPANATKEFTDCANAILPTPTRSGYTFAGWYEGSTKVDAINQNKNYALSAKWEVETYSVKFVAEGVEVETLSYTVANKNITEPSVPEKTHYTGAWEAYTLDSGNKVVNAVYTPVTYTVTFVADGVTVEVINYTVETTTITEPSVPAKDHNTGAWEAYTLTGGNVTVNAVYTPVTYTVTFDAAGGAITQGSATVNGGNTVAKPVDPIKSGYIFKGWLLNNAAYDFATPVTENITLVASWEAEQVQPTTYTVTFDAQGGSAVDPQTVEEGKAATKPADPTKAGYIFKGWLLNSAAYDFSTPVTGDITLVASWEEEVVQPTTYTVTFDAQGGSAVDPQTVEEGAAATKPANPTKTGYIFKGWLLNNAAYDFSTPVTGNITLVASWEEIPANTYTVTFKADGQVVEVVTYEAGATSVTEPAVPAKQHYNGSWASYTLNDTNLEVNAEYTAKEYKLTFKAGGETVQEVTYTYGVTSVTEPAVPAKQHYTGSWPIYTLDGDKEVVAVYTAVEYSVKFMADDTEVETLTYSLDNTDITAPSVPAKDHYTGAWESYTLDGGDKVVNAVYTLVTYTISLDAGDGTVDPESITFTVEDALADITLPTPTRDGYEFVGWYEGTTKVEAIAECKDYELTAEWEEILEPATVTYNFNGGEYIPAYEFMIKNFNDNTDSVLGTGADNGIATAEIQSKGTYMNRFWTRILIKYNETLGLWESVGVGGTENGKDANGNNIVDVATYVIGTQAANSSDKEYGYANRNMIIALHKLVGEGTKLYFDLGDLDNTTPNANWNKHVNVYTEGPELALIKGNQLVYEKTTEDLVVARKTGYDFVGWFTNEELTGDAVTAITLTKEAQSISLYAKYTPTTYTITYNLSGGSTTATLVEEYTIESNTITLPTSDAMTIENGTFLGWYDEDNNQVTEIVKGSIGNITLTAQWEVSTVNTLTVKDVDATALNAVFTDKSQVPTILVASTVTDAGKYVLSNANLSSGYTDVEYVYGTTIFSSISAALQKVEENAVIYVFAGTYAESFTLNKAGLVLAGANYNISGSATRATEETDITGKITIEASATINGIKMSGGSGSDSLSPITLAETIDGVTIKNSYFAQDYLASTGYANNRRAVINQLSGAKTTNLVISDNKFDGTIFSGSYLKYMLAVSSGENISFINNEISGTLHTTNAVYLYSGTSGTFNFYGNTSGYDYTSAGSATVVTTAPTE